jgi:hypothetical protein
MGWLAKIFGAGRGAKTRPDDAAALEKLTPWRERHRRVAWVPRTEDRDGPAAASKFCGAAVLREGERWPVCGACGIPMPLFLQLDLAATAADTGLPLGEGLLQLFYCVEECDAQHWEPFTEGKLVRVLPPGAAGPAGTPPPAPTRGEPLSPKRITGWEPVEDHPSPEELDELGLEVAWDFKARPQRLTVRWPEQRVAVETADLDLLEKLGVPRSGDKLAGWPAWVQGVEYPSCPRCGRRMELVFQLDSHDHVNWMFGDAGCGHVTRCPDHPDVVAFGWACC